MPRPKKPGIYMGGQLASRLMGQVELAKIKLKLLEKLIKSLENSLKGKNR